MKVLFCTDGSDISLYAIEKALKFIKKDFVVDIVTVIEISFLTNFITFPYETEEGFPEYKNTAEEFLEKSANLIQMRKFEVGEKYLLEGNTVDEILNLISNGSYSAVILGSHGKKGFKKWLGSVSSKISQKSPIPVLVVKPFNAVNFVEGKKEFLITADGSKNSYVSIETSLKILDFSEVSVEILTVKSPVQDFPVEIRDDEEWLCSCLKKQDEIMNEILDKTAKILEDNNVKEIKKTVITGYPVEEILKHTENNCKDLIIMGSHGREGLSYFILGSVSKAVLENTSCPVLIIHNKP